MSAVVVVGLQWGDEGKGKITDYLASKADYVVRYQGGNNAGHTVVVGEEEFKLHLIPSGVLYPDKQCLLGNGVVINPAVMLDELAGLKAKGVDISNIRVSDRAHVIMPYHTIIDKGNEERRTVGKIGTTGRGIGPAYVDKYDRYDAIRICDFVDPEIFAERLPEIIRIKNEAITKLYGGQPLDAEKILAEYQKYADAIRPMVVDTSVLVDRAIRKGEKVLFEGAQGTLLDVDHGTYPFVSSSSSSAGGATIGGGVGPTRINKVVGIIKAYSTRVGEGPFPTELPDEQVSMLRDGRGREYGVTTGRPRRCGWFDGVIAEYSVRINGISDLAVMKLDVLDQLDTIKICTGYRYKNSVMKEFPASLKVLAECQPIYEEIPGWKCDTTGCRQYSDLPKQTQDYLKRISDLAGAQVSLASVGWKRDETIIVNEIW